MCYFDGKGTAASSPNTLEAHPSSQGQPRKSNETKEIVEKDHAPAATIENEGEIISKQKMLGNFNHG